MKTCKPVPFFNVVDLSATAFKIKITRKEVFGLHIIPENHKVNPLLSQDSQLRRKKTIDRKVCLMKSSSLNVQLARDRNSSEIFQRLTFGGFAIYSGRHETVRHRYFP